MSNKLHNLIDIFDIGDLSFFILLAKKNIKNLLLSSFLISFVVFFISLNLEKKYLSEATLVIAQDENKITNIEEAYSSEATFNRVNNQIAILKSDEVIEYVVNDENNTLEFKELYSSKKKNKEFPQDIFDNIFLNIEFHIRELGYGDVTVNKKMKTLTRIFYDILLKINKSGLSGFAANDKILKSYFEPQSSNSSVLTASLSSYFNAFYNFCFELKTINMLKGQINFKYTK